MEVGPQRTSDKFSLSGVFSMEDSLFQIIKNKTESISGIVIPWGYVAAKYSTFCWHTEDLFLYSLNYMHKGGCKIWYGIPYADVEKARAVLLEEYQEELKRRPGLLDEVICMFSPIKFMQKGVIAS
jgi:hypothetical protein